MTSNSELVDTYNKIISIIGETDYKVLSPIDTMKFNGSDEDRYDRAMNVLDETKIMIAEMSNVSTG